MVPTLLHHAGCPNQADSLFGAKKPKFRVRRVHKGVCKRVAGTLWPWPSNESPPPARKRVGAGKTTSRSTAASATRSGQGGAGGQATSSGYSRGRSQQKQPSRISSSQARGQAAVDGRSFAGSKGAAASLGFRLVDNDDHEENREGGEAWLHNRSTLLDGGNLSMGHLGGSKV